MTDQPDSASQPEMPSWVNKTPYEVWGFVVGYLGREDIHNLVYTCKQLSFMMTPYLIKHDIKTKTYNSLAWACYYGDDALATTCLSLGASPNATFWDRKRSADPFEPSSPRETTVRHTGYDFVEIFRLRENPRPDLQFSVYPTKTEYGGPLLRAWLPYSALNVATMRNHVTVMRVLLDAGARQFDHRLTIKTLVSPWSIQSLHHEYPHQVTWSYVRSVEAAKALLEAGGAEYLNEKGDSSFSPLEVILSRFTVDHRRGPGFKRGFTSLSERSLYELIKLLLSNGASPRGAHHRYCSDSDRYNCLGKNGTPCGPLTAAVQTMQAPLLKLMYESGPTDVNHPDNYEFDDIYIFAIGEYRQNPWGDALLSVLHSVGIPIVQPRKRFLLSYVISQKIHDETCPSGNLKHPIHVLVKAGADVNESDSNTLCPLSQAVASVDIGYPNGDDQRSARRHNNKHVKAILKYRPDLEKPAFRHGGFTPLFIASADKVSTHTFGLLLKAGCRINTYCQPPQDGLEFSIVQCILRGLPTIDGTGRPREKKTKGKGWPENFGSDRAAVSRREGGLRYLVARKKIKFNLVYSKAKDQTALLYTPENRHVLNWSLQWLKEYELDNAVNLLTPLYRDTKRETDMENPLLVLFDAIEGENYLRIGTLGHTAAILKILLNAGFSQIPAESPGETVLHRVCQLFYLDITDDMKTSFVQQRQWYSNHDFKGVDFIVNKRQEEKSGLFGSRTRSRVVLKWEDILANKEEYLRRRNETIISMVHMLLKKGNPGGLYVQDGRGKRPYDYAKENHLLEHIKENYRDSSLERKRKRPAASSPPGDQPSTKKRNRG